jgi:arylsulfatase A-like enzyme
MVRTTEVRRVIVVVLDGLRPDAIDAFGLVNVQQLMQLGASTLCAQTVRPSLTWPALASLLTGVDPDVHGIHSDTLQIPRPRTPLKPLPELLLGAGYPSTAFLEELPALYKMFGARIAERLGFHQVRFSGATAREVLFAARKTLSEQRRGLVFMHWADADRAGHAHGWMSRQYGEALCRLDSALGLLASTLEIETDPHTVLIALADHGGGGWVETSHEDDHPLNTTIPLIMAGGCVEPGLIGDATLLDVPATIAWALGVTPDRSYAGRPLVEAFTLASDAPVQARGGAGYSVSATDVPMAMS